MKQGLLLLLCLVSSGLSFAKELTFGESVDVSKVVTLEHIVAAPKHYLNKKVTVAGTVEGVCEKRGCWMTIVAKSGFDTLRIKVPDGKMVFPMSAKGRQAFAVGTLTAKQLSVKKTRHYQEKLANKSGQPFDTTQITTGMIIYQLAPTGVVIADH